MSTAVTGARTRKTPAPNAAETHDHKLLAVWIGIAILLAGVAVFVSIREASRASAAARTVADFEERLADARAELDARSAELSQEVHFITEKSKSVQKQLDDHRSEIAELREEFLSTQLAAIKKTVESSEALANGDRENMKLIVSAMLYMHNVQEATQIIANSYDTGDAEARRRANASLIEARNVYPTPVPRTEPDVAPSAP